MIKRKFRYVIPKISNLIELWHSHLWNLASDVGIMSRNSNYTKFILLGRARTGSNFLRGLLNSHSQIIAFGEIFRHHDVIGWDFSYSPQSRRTLSLLQNDPIEFLETSVFGNFAEHISAVGFKIFYEHAHDDAWEPIWTYLSSRKDLKVIHVKRRNMLRTHLSLKRATAMDAWVRKSSVDPDYDRPISLSYEECLEDFTRTYEAERQYDAFFENQAKTDVIYENLSRDYVGEMRRVQGFLGVDYEPTEPRTVKQSSHPLSSAILNYSELKEMFAGTSWQEFFED